MRQMPKIGAVVLVGILAATATVSRAQSPYGIGRTATPAEIAGWNIDIGRDGSGLPVGRGSVSHGREVYQISAPPVTATTARAASATGWWVARER